MLFYKGLNIKETRRNFADALTLAHCTSNKSDLGVDSEDCTWRSLLKAVIFKFIQKPNVSNYFMCLAW